MFAVVFMTASDAMDWGGGGVQIVSCSRAKILYSKLGTQCFWKAEKKFLAVCLLKCYTKVLEVVFAPSL